MNEKLRKAYDLGFKHGKEYNEIGEERVWKFKTDKTTTSSVSPRRKFKRAKHGKSWKVGERNRAKRMFKKGASFEEIALNLQRSVEAVKYQLFYAPWSTMRMSDRK